MKINIFDLGVLCVYAIRYMMGRDHFAAPTVRRIVKPLLPSLPDKIIVMMRKDVQAQKDMGMYGSEREEWKQWEQEVSREWKRRKI